MSPSRPNSDPRMRAWAAVVYRLGVPVILLALTVPAAADAMLHSNASDEVKALATAEAESAEATRPVPAEERRILLFRAGHKHLPSLRTLEHIGDPGELLL